MIQAVRCRWCGQDVKGWQGLSRHVKAAHGTNIYTYMSFNLDQLQDRILSNIVKAPAPEGYHVPGECWIWQGRAAGRTAHGQMRLAGAPTEEAHRLSWYAWTGTLPSDEYLLHACDVGMCVRPNHMRLGSHQENMEDRCERGRTCKGADHYATCLTEEKVKEIRLRATWGHNNSTIAEEFGQTTQTIRRIVNGDTWAHVPYDQEYDGNFIPW